MHGPLNVKSKKMCVFVCVCVCLRESKYSGSQWRQRLWLFMSEKLQV